MFRWEIDFDALRAVFRQRLLTRAPHDGRAGIRFHPFARKRPQHHPDLRRADVRRTALFIIADVFFANTNGAPFMSN
jgi:hypothetical protein